MDRTFSNWLKLWKLASISIFIAEGPILKAGSCSDDTKAHPPGAIVMQSCKTPFYKVDTRSNSGTPLPLYRLHKLEAHVPGLEEAADRKRSIAAAASKLPSHFILKNKNVQFAIDTCGVQRYGGKQGRVTDSQRYERTTQPKHLSSILSILTCHVFGPFQGT